MGPLMLQYQCLPVLSHSKTKIYCCDLGCQHRRNTSSDELRRKDSFDILIFEDKFTFVPFHLFLDLPFPIGAQTFEIVP